MRCAGGGAGGGLLVEVRRWRSLYNYFIYDYYPKHVNAYDYGYNINYNNSRRSGGGPPVQVHWWRSAGEGPPVEVRRWRSAGGGPPVEVCRWRSAGEVRWGRSAYNYYNYNYYPNHVHIYDYDHSLNYDNNNNYQKMMIKVI